MNAQLIFSSIETEMLINLITLLVEGSDIGGAEWQLSKLQQLGKLRSMNISAVKNGRSALIKAIRDEISKDAFARASSVDEQVKSAGKLFQVMSPEVDPQLVEIVKRWESAAEQKFGNAFAPMIAKADSIYTDTIYKAAAKHQLGISGRQAIAEACLDWAGDGIQAFTDAAGRSWTTEAYAQLVIRSNSVLAATETQFARMTELDADLIEVSSHLGARPKCEPYQGKIFSISGRSKNYPPLSSTSYGEADGLFGCNCRHISYPYFPGTKKTFDPQPQERNETAYANSQAQRKLEREIRSDKRAVAILEKTGSEKDINDAKRKLHTAELNMREFIESTGRKRRSDREEIYVKL